MSNDQAIEQEIQAKGLTAPRITPAHIQACIASEHYFTAREAVFMSAKTPEELMGIGKSHPLALLTFCVLVLRNGFTVTGESACASPENFDAEIGRKIARENAVNKVWMLEGYLLKEKLAFVSIDGRLPTPHSALPPHQQRVIDERAELVEKSAKLEAFIGTPIYCGLPSDEQARLAHQFGIMESYCDVLAERIAAF
jgi:hypothetical protein